MRPRVLRQMLEVGADQVADGDQVAVGAVAAGTRFGGLDTTVDAFGKAVAEPGAEVFEGAIAVLLDRGREALEGCQSTAPRPADPGAQQGFGLRKLAAAGKHLPQRLFESPRTRRLQVRALQPVHLVELRARPVRRVLKRAPADVFQVAHLLDLGAPHLIQRRVGQRHHVERVEADRRVRAVLARARLVGGSQVQADVGDRLGVAAVRRQVVGKGFERRRVAPLRGKQQATGVEVAEQRQEALPLARAALVRAHATHGAVVLAGTRRVHVKVQHAPDAAVGHPQQARHRTHRHLRAQRNDESLQRFREPRTRPRPGHAHLCRLPACLATHARNVGLDDRLVLEEVQVLPCARQAIVNGLVGGATGGASQPLGRVLDREDDATGSLLKVDVSHAPRRGEPEGLSEERFHRASLPAGGCLLQDRLRVTHTRRERA